MPKRTVLIIDDEKLWLKILAGFLTKEGYEVHTAQTSAAGVALAELHQPACILLDYHLAADTAEDVCRLIKAKETIKDIPIIILSNDATQDLAAYLECRAVSFIHKFGPLGRILAAVENLLWQLKAAQGILEKGDIRLEPMSLRAYQNMEPLPILNREQFRLFYLLVEKSPAFVKEDDIALYVYGQDVSLQKPDSVRGLAHRTRASLTPWLRRRIKNKAGRGWIYVQPKP